MKKRLTPLMSLPSNFCKHVTFALAMNSQHNPISQLIPLPFLTCNKLSNSSLQCFDIKLFVICMNTFCSTNALSMYAVIEPNSIEYINTPSDHSSLFLESVSGLNTCLTVSHM